MLLHLGGGYAVDSRRIVMLIDLKSHPAAALPLMENLARRKALIRLDGDAATLALCQQADEDISGIVSPIGLRTLRQRVSEAPALFID